MKKTIFFVAAALSAVILTGCAGNTADSNSSVQATSQAVQTIDTAEAFEYTEKDGSIYIDKYTGKEQTVVIPSEINGCAVTGVSVYFLEGTDVTEITYPDSISEIHLPQKCSSLSTVNLPSSVIDFDAKNNQYSPSIERINIADGGEYSSIDGALYSADGKTLVYLPRGRRGSFAIPDGIEVIGKYALYKASISTVTFSDSVSVIEDYAFAYCDCITEIALSSSVREIRQCAFADCGIEKITLNDGLESIGNGAFLRTALKELYVPDSVVECGTMLFSTDRQVAVSLPTHKDGLQNLYDMLTDFRDETMLAEAIRNAGKANNYIDGRIFLDITRDNFPEMAESNNGYFFFYTYNAERNCWEDINISSPLKIYRYKENGKLYCISEVTEFYTVMRISNLEDFSDTVWYSIFDDIDINTSSSPDFDYEAAYNEWEKDFYEKLLSDGYEFVEEIDPNVYLEDYTFDKKFDIVTQRFSEEPCDDYADFDKSGSMLWGDTEITEYPHIFSYYPTGMSVEVDGKDILNGEEVEGVSFCGDTLTLDNVNIVIKDRNESCINCHGIDRLKIELIGDNVVDSYMASSINVANGSLEIGGSGTLTTRILKGIATDYSYPTLTITDDAVVKKSEATEGAGTPCVVFRRFVLSGNGSMYSDEVNCSDLLLSDNAYLSTKYITSYDTITLEDKSRMEVTADPDDYPKYKDIYGEGRAVRTEHIAISDYAELSVTNYCNEAIFIDSNFGDIKLYDNGKLFVTGNSHSWAIDLDYTAYGVLELNDNSTVSIEGSYICIVSQAININGGTLICNSTEDGAAVIINNRYRTHFDDGLNINGEIIEQTPSGIDFIPDGDSERYELLATDGNAVISYRVTVKPTERNENQ